MFPEIDSKTLKEWMKNPDVLLVDVREPSEFESERIKGAGESYHVRYRRAGLDRILSVLPADNTVLH